MPRRASETGWGGAREGAGRKPKGRVKKETVAVSISGDVLQKAKDEARRREISVSALVEMALKAFLDKE